MGNNPEAGTLVLLLTHARTCSHLLERMLSKQPNTYYGSHHFVTVRLAKSKLLMEGPIDKTKKASRDELKLQYELGYRDLMEYLTSGERSGKAMFLHLQPHIAMSPVVASKYVYGEEYSKGEPNFWLVGQPGNTGKAHTNILVLPDELLLKPGTKPILNFRHPFLVIDGIYRGMTTLTANATPENLMYGCTLRWTRIMYDWYVEHGRPVGIEPILIDAEDYMGPQKEEYMRELCERADLDPDSVIYNWEKETVKEGDEGKILVLSKKTLMSSDGVMPGYDLRGRNVEEGVAAWKEKYGDEVGNFLKGLLDKAMPDYEYLRARRLVPTNSQE